MTSNDVSGVICLTLAAPFGIYAMFNTLMYIAYILTT
jgi:hypothetical protein